MMTLPEPTDRVNGELMGLKDVLPGKRAVGIWVFALKSVREVDSAEALREVEVVLGSHLLEVEAQGFEQNVREHSAAVILALAVTDDNLAVGEVEILYPQAHDFHQAESTAVHDLGHKFVDTIHVGDDLFRLLPGEDSWNTFGLSGTDRDQSLFVQLDAKNVAVEKEDGADGLVLGGSGNGLLIDEVGNEVVDLDYAHVARMALVVEENVLADPADVGLFGAEGIMAVAEELAILVKQLLGFPRGWDILR